ncbi:hypothetical protein HYX07_02925 [Candidatus Woesearchaeota archaeon]|nr:hypothetical protein [Candidatus Woesearchaeota archaeon]
MAISLYLSNERKALVESRPYASGEMISVAAMFEGLIAFSRANELERTATLASDWTFLTGLPTLLDFADAVFRDLPLNHIIKKDYTLFAEASKVIHEYIAKNIGIWSP